jgi:HEAT repeat protein
MYMESDPRVIEVLDVARRSSSRVVRLRAVCMLANVGFEKRAEWLTEACGDADLSVRQAAGAVIAWTLEPSPPPWPQREDPEFDKTPELTEAEAALDEGAELGWEWEYAVEVWAGDGMLVGVFLCATCQEDTEHAKKIALGQAVLASARPSGDRFDPATAAAFVVAKRRVRRGTGLPGARRRRHQSR